MKYLTSISLLLWCVILISGCGNEAASERNDGQHPRNWALAIHGGAGHFGEEDLSEELQARYESSLDAALRIGESMLDEGKSSVDAVEAVIRFLEDDSLFNAGRGAVFTAEGRHELDASIADGSTRNCGAITGLQGFKHPISVARSVMDSSEHVFFSGSGAGEYAFSMGHEMADSSWFWTDKAYQRYLKIHQKSEAHSGSAQLDKKGTVGCVALDRDGNIAAGTSTGGMTYKQHGRIGDSPIIGAGTWADNRTCAASCTGWGEYFIRTGVAQDIHGRMLHGNESVVEACRKSIFDEMGELGGDGGVICLDRDGTIALVCNSRGMFRAWAHPKGRGIAMFGATLEGTVEVY